MKLSYKTFYLVDHSAKWLNNVIIAVAVVLALFWIILRKNELEAWLALLGLVSRQVDKVG